MSEEIKEIKEDLKECISATHQNSLAIKELAVISTQATKDSDKLIKHLDKVLPVLEVVNAITTRVQNLEDEAKEGIRPKTLKELLKWGAIIIIGFGTWITLMFFAIDKLMTAHADAQVIREINIDKKLEKQENKIQDNKNQITYLKGRIK